MEIVDGETAELVLVVQAHTGSITGVVMGPDGPVPDAFVDAGRESDTATSPQHVHFSGKKARLTDGDGRFELAGLQPGKYTISAKRKGGGGEARLEHAELGSDVVVVLKETASISGSVVDGTGAAPERFKISIRNVALLKRDNTQRLFRTQGQWRVEGLAPGTYNLSAKSAGGTMDVEVVLAAGESKDDIVLELVERTSVRGRVVDLETGEPLPGFSISIGSAQGSATFLDSTARDDKKNITDADGWFEFDGVPMGRIGVIVSAWGMRDVYNDVTVHTTLAPGKPELPTIRVPNKKRDETGPGELGFKTQPLGDDVDSETRPLTVGFVRPGGPAAAAGLKVGDVVVALGGHDVTGENRYRYKTLRDVGPGMTVNVGLKTELAGRARFGWPACTVEQQRHLPRPQHGRRGPELAAAPWVWARQNIDLEHTGQQLRPSDFRRRGWAGVFRVDRTSDGACLRASRARGCDTPGCRGEP